MSELRSQWQNGSAYFCHITTCCMKCWCGRPYWVQVICWAWSPNMNFNLLLHSTDNRLPVRMCQSSPNNHYNSLTSLLLLHSMHASTVPLSKANRSKCHTQAHCKQSRTCQEHPVHVALHQMYVSLIALKARDPLSDMQDAIQQQLWGLLWACFDDPCVHSTVTAMIGLQTSIVKYISVTVC